MTVLVYYRCIYISLYQCYTFEWLEQTVMHVYLSWLTVQFTETMQGDWDEESIKLS